MNLMKGGIMSNQKDIVLIPFPYSDLSTMKKRPALIISNEKMRGEDFICCLVTSKPHKDDLQISKEFFGEGTLPFKSFVKPHRIFTIHKGVIIKKLCTIKKEFHNSVVEKINKYLKSD